MNSRPPDCMELMKRIHDVLEKNANHGLMRHGITFAQLHMLMALDRAEDGTQKLKELEKYFCVAQSTAAGLAVRLEKKGLVQSFADAGDRRVKQLRITDAGREICRDTRANMEETRRRFLSGLDPEEQEQFTRLLQKVYHAIR